LARQMERPSTVFAAAPGEPGFGARLRVCAHSLNVSAERIFASEGRGKQRPY
jgi:hypothetical protein